MSDLVDLSGVSRYYGARQHQFLAVQDVNLKIHEGEFVALLGPRVAARARFFGSSPVSMAPSEGRVLYRGQPLQV